MRLYKKYCCESQNYSDCVELVEACAHENGCDYLIECLSDVYIGYLLMQESNLAPAADVVEVRHGKWEKQQFIVRSGFFSVKDFTCSNCFENFSVEQGKGLMNYCPNCGAKMDGKDGE